MRFLCNSCDQTLHSNHYWTGMIVICPSCGEATALKYREGQRIPDTEYSIAFDEFKHLVTYAPYAKAIDPLIEKLLDCSVSRTKEGVRLVARDGSLIPFEVAHFEIQLNSSSQRRLYGAAMSQWR